LPANFVSLSSHHQIFARLRGHRRISDSQKKNHNHKKKYLINFYLPKFHMQSVIGQCVIKYPKVMHQNRYNWIMDRIYIKYIGNNPTVKQCAPSEHCIFISFLPKKIKFMVERKNILKWYFKVIYKKRILFRFCICNLILSNSVFFLLLVKNFWLVHSIA
jgi:hypothetical protein